LRKSEVNSTAEIEQDELQRLQGAPEGMQRNLRFEIVLAVDRNSRSPRKRYLVSRKVFRQERPYFLYLLRTGISTAWYTRVLCLPLSSENLFILLFFLIKFRFYLFIYFWILALCQSLFIYFSSYVASPWPREKGRKRKKPELTWPTGQRGPDP